MFFRHLDFPPSRRVALNAEVSWRARLTSSAVCKLSWWCATRETAALSLLRSRAIGWTVTWFRHDGREDLLRDFRRETKSGGIDLHDARAHTARSATDRELARRAKSHRSQGRSVLRIEPRLTHNRSIATTQLAERSQCGVGERVLRSVISHGAHRGCERNCIATQSQ